MEARQAVKEQNTNIPRRGASPCRLGTRRMRLGELQKFRWNRQIHRKTPVIATG